MEDKNKKILDELTAIAFARAADVVQVVQGRLTVADTDGLAASQLAAIASVEQSSTGVKVKFYDKLKALELLGKAAGLFENAGAQQPDNGLLEAILTALEHKGRENTAQNEENI